jgi:peptide/nickel transport system permease protein
MARYIGGRVIQLIVIIFFISVVAFMMVHLLPGNPTTSILGPNDTAQAQALLLKQLGLNKPLPLQYWTWISNVFHGNLGVSFLTHQTVANAIGEAFPIDLELIIVSQLIAFIVAIPLALVAALRPNRLFDRIATTSTYAMLAVPTFVVAVILVLLVAVKIHIFPATGFNPLGQGIGPNLKSVLLPSIALAVGSVAIYYRLLRADMIATLQEDFITMARAKGLSTTYILLRHALRPSSFALLAGAGLSIGSLFTGAFVVEILFPLPGIGFQLIAAINSRDYLVVQGMALVAAVAYVVINFGVDILFTFLDPRVRRG